MAVLEVTNAKPLLDLAFNPKLAEMVKGLPPYKEQVAKPQFQQFLLLVKYFETKLGGDWQSNVRKLLDGGVTIAAYPNGDSIAIVDAADPKILEQLHEVVLTIAKGEAAKKGQPESVKSQEYQGVTGWTFGPGEAHAIVGKRLLLTNRPTRLKQTVELRGKPGESIARLPAYQAATKAAGSAAVRTFVNLAAVKKTPGMQKALTENANPMAALLFAGATDALRGANWASAALQVESGALVLKLTMDGQPVDAKSPTAFTWPAGSDGALPNLDVPRRMAAMSFYRDLHGFYAAKDKLFPERTSGLIFFENMMGIFFTRPRPDRRGPGRDEARGPRGRRRAGVRSGHRHAAGADAGLRRDLPREEPQAVRRGDGRGVAEGHRAGQLHARPEGRAGADHRPGHARRRALHAVAYFSSAGQKTKTGLDMRFNFRPTLARVGDTWSSVRPTAWPRT